MGIYGRLTAADLKILDAFGSTQSTTSVARTDFYDGWNFSGTLGVKGFYPYNALVGIGAFVQGSYFFGDFRDQVAGTTSGAPFISELDIKNPWDINVGIGLQAMAPYDTKFYLGPYFYYMEARTDQSPNIPGLRFTSNVLRNSSQFGVFAGADMPIGRGFHFNAEAQYSERISAGAAITFVY